MFFYFLITLELSLKPELNDDVDKVWLQYFFKQFSCIRLSNFVFIFLVRLAILRYLSQKYTNFAGWGKAPEDRYRVHSVLDWASSELLK